MSIRIDLSQDPEISKKIKTRQIRTTLLKDLPRLNKHVFIFNGTKTTFKYEQNNNQETAYQCFANLAKHHDIQCNDLKWSRFIEGMNQNGFLHCTELAVKDAVLLNGYISTTTVSAQYEINQRKNASNLDIVEHVIVKDSNKKVCATFKTHYSISDQNVQYYDTLINLKSNYGKQVFSETRSLVTKIIEYFKETINQRSFSSFNFFNKKKEIIRDLTNNNTSKNYDEYLTESNKKTVENKSSFNSRSSLKI